MRRCRQVPRLDSRPIRVEVLQAKGLERLDEDSLRTTPEDIRQDHAAQMIDRLPQPATVFSPINIWETRPKG